MKHSIFGTRILANEEANYSEGSPLRMVTAGAGMNAPERTASPLRERLRRFMYPIHIIERVVNFLGVIGILAIIAASVMGCLGQKVPESIIFAMGTSIGALAGIAQGSNAKGAAAEKEGRERQIAGMDGH